MTMKVCRVIGELKTIPPLSTVYLVVISTAKGPTNTGALQGVGAPTRFLHQHAKR